MAIVEPGMRFGYLTALVKVRDGGRTYWHVLCDCGTKKKVQQAQLKGAARPIKSCGCKRIELLSKARTKHGQSMRGRSEHFSTFVAWQAMIWRCNNKARKDYPLYGGRGITVCERWRHSFENFMADLGPKPVGCSVGRINNDGNYEPSNCRWETTKQQARNKRSNRVIEWDGRRQTLVEWSEETGIPRDTLAWRIDRGWTVAHSLTRPVDV